MPSGKYSYTNPEEGNTKDMGKVPPLECPNGGKNVGMYHTHLRIQSVNATHLSNC
ncbi:hypothetical protein GTP77_16940 [Massilia sp. FT127W]|uniref:Uncharacterized protein n=2 Tax=Pseudoduganella aquatica TaxID=2660641 RepID=A0A7X4KNB3_9BURK|nr:hypothetical protein [Pseudoduganella aquatica]